MTQRRLEVSTRDRLTLELRQHFDVPHVSDEKRAYETKVWFYFPRGFGISPATWSPDAFYKDVSNSLRLHAPGLGLRDFADLEHPQNPATILRYQLPKLIEDSAPGGETLDILAKTLGAELADATTSAARGLSQRVAEANVDDDHGRLWFCGRKAHRVVTEDKTYFTIPVERVLNTHPDVRRTALVGIKRGGEVIPVICVELHPDEPHITIDQITADLKELAAKYDHTQGITEFLRHDGFPMDVRHNAKIFREQLAAWAGTKLA